jgi:hypothetical protein
MLSSYHESPAVSGGTGNMYFDLSHYTGTLTNKYFAWHAAPVLTARGLSTEMMRLHVLSDGDGYLGIGTKGVPEHRLHVSGNSKVDGNLYVNGTQSIFSGTSSHDLVRITQNGSGNAFVVEDSSNPDTTSFIIDNSGRVGIGTSSATHLLTLGNDGGISIYGANSGYVYIKSKSSVTSWTASLPSNKGNITQFVYNNFGGEMMLNDGEGNLYFGNTPSLYLPTNYIYIGNTHSYAQGRTFSGDINSDYTGVITIQTGVVSYNKIQTVSQKSILGSPNIGGGVVSEIPMYNQYISIGSASTALENPSNWTGLTYSGPSITGTYQGQNHYNGSYLYTAVDDNLWIRLSRV